MKVLIVLTVCTLFIGVYGASIPDGYDDPIYDGLGDGEGPAADNYETNSGSEPIYDSLAYNAPINEPINDDPVYSASFRARRFSCGDLS